MDFTAYTTYLTDALSGVDTGAIEQLIDLLDRARSEDRTVYVIGNGGSAANASHFAQDLAKGTLSSPAAERRLRALSLTDNLPFFSALGNDEGYDQVFVQQLRTYAREGDLLIAISGSGNSPNILRAVEWAAGKGVTVVGVTGFDGGELAGRVDLSLHVPLEDMCTAESIHTVLFHYVVLELQRRFARDDR